MVWQGNWSRLLLLMLYHQCILEQQLAVVQVLLGHTSMLGTGTSAPDEIAGFPLWSGGSHLFPTQWVCQVKIHLGTDELCAMLRMDWQCRIWGLDLDVWHFVMDLWRNPLRWHLVMDLRLDLVLGNGSSKCCTSVAGGKMPGELAVGLKPT